MHLILNRTELDILLGQHLHQLSNIRGHHVVALVNQLLIQHLECLEVQQLQHLAHLIDIGKIARRYVMLVLDLLVDSVQIADNLLLLRVLAEHGGHLTLNLTDYVRVDFGQSRSLYQVVELSQRRVFRQALQVLEQVL